MIKIFLFTFFLTFISCKGGGSSGTSASESKKEDGGAAPVSDVVGRPFLVQLGAKTKAAGANNNGADECLSVAVDKNKNVYCAGTTSGDLGEANGGSNDAFIMKTDKAGNIKWITQLGAVTKGSGADNSGDDKCASVAVDHSGNVYCAGSTTGALGEANAGSLDAFIMKLNSSGAVQWITQLGANTTAVSGGNTHIDICSAVAVDDLGFVYCAGRTFGKLGERSAGQYDAFVMKLDSSGALQWVTQLGETTKFPGSDNSGYDECKGISLDTSSNIYCAGETGGALGEANGGSRDAFIMKLDSGGALKWITQLGATTKVSGGDTSGSDSCNDVVVDSSLNVYCAGETTGALSESRTDKDAFVLKLDNTGALQWVTQLGNTTTPISNGNSGPDTCLGVDVDSSGNVYCAGKTHGSLGEKNARNSDVFVMKINNTGALQWITQFGANTKSGGDNLGVDECKGIAIDSSANIYCAGKTNGALGEASGGNTDAFILKLDSSGKL